MFEHYTAGKPLTWHINRENTIYDDPEGTDMFHDSLFLNAANRIMNFYQQKKDKAAATREHNKMKKSDDYY